MNQIYDQKIQGIVVQHAGNKFDVAVGHIKEPSLFTKILMLNIKTPTSILFRRYGPSEFFFRWTDTPI